MMMKDRPDEKTTEEIRSGTNDERRPPEKRRGHPKTMEESRGKQSPEKTADTAQDEKKTRNRKLEGLRRREDDQRPTEKTKSSEGFKRQTEDRAKNEARLRDAENRRYEERQKLIEEKKREVQDRLEQQKAQKVSWLLLVSCKWPYVG